MIKINKNRGQIDTSVAVGIIFVIGIIVAVSFGIYYFGYEKPRLEKLRASKQTTLQTLTRYDDEVDTSQFENKISTYKIQIEEADSLDKLNSIRAELSALYEREKFRAQLLNFSKSITFGTFDNLGELYEDIKVAINNKGSLTGLKNLKDDIEEEVTAAWRDHHLESISNAQTSYTVMVREDSPISESYFLKDKARSYVEDESWEVLQQVKFVESNTFEVSIIDTFEKVPLVEEGYRVDVYEYTGDNTIRRVSNTTVLEVIYPKDVISTVNWSATRDNSTFSYSADLWEEIKAASAGAENAKRQWDNWAETVVQTARENANIGDRDLPAMYVVKVTNWKVAKELTHIEHLQDKGDIVLVGRVPD